MNDYDFDANFIDQKDFKEDELIEENHDIQIKEIEEKRVKEDNNNQNNIPKKKKEKKDKNTHPATYNQQPVIAANIQILIIQKTKVWKTTK